MAMTDLVIWPRANSLRYARDKFDAMRVVFEDLERASFDPAKIRQIAREGRGAAISAKATMDDAIDDAVRDAIRKPHP